MEPIQRSTASLEGQNSAEQCHLEMLASTMYVFFSNLYAQYMSSSLIKAVSKIDSYK